VAIDVLPDRFAPPVRRRLKQAVRVIILAFAFFGLVVGGSRLVYVTLVLEQYSPALRLPLAYVYLAIPISGLLIIYYKAYDLLTR
jgi:TRAP-type C4-dicarboxylate transport system permease small subunit